MIIIRIAAGVLFLIIAIVSRLADNSVERVWDPISLMAAIISSLVFACTISPHHDVWALVLTLVFTGIEYGIIRVAEFIHEISDMKPPFFR